MTDVSIFEQSPDLPLAEESKFEPGFEYSRAALNPNHTDPRWCEGLVKHLDRLIIRNPGDLTPHIQRINALLAAGYTGDRVFAAALDLHTVLGVNGMALQRRIHEQIFPVLDDRQRADLVAVRSGAKIAVSSAEQYCSLARQAAGSVQLVSKKQESSLGNGTPVDFDIGG